MKLNEKHYFIFKMVQLISSIFLGILTIILVALPQTDLDISSGIELIIACAGMNFLANGVKLKQPETQTEN